MTTPTSGSGSSSSIHRVVDQCSWTTVGVHAALVIAPTLFSGMLVLSKASFDYIHPLWFMLARQCIGCILLFIVAFAQKRSFDAMLPRTNKVWALLAGGGVIGYWGNAVCFNMGLDSSSVSQAGAFQPLVPLFVMMMSIYLNFEKSTPWKWIGVLLAAIGVLFYMVGRAIFQPSEGEDIHNIKGGAFFLGQTVCWATYILFTKSVSIEEFDSPILITAFSFFFSLPPTILTALAFEPFTHADYRSIQSLPGEVWVALIYASTAAAMLANGLNVWATKQTTPTIVGIYNCVQPITATIMGVVFLHEYIDTYAYIGGTAIVIGVFITVWDKMRDDATTEYVQRLEVEDLEWSPHGSIDLDPVKRKRARDSLRAAAPSTPVTGRDRYDFGE